MRKRDRIPQKGLIVLQARLAPSCFKNEKQSGCNAHHAQVHNTQKEANDDDLAFETKSP